MLASGHLHPGMLFLRFLDGLRGTLLPLIVAIVAQLPLLGALVGGWFVLSMAYALVRYLTFEYVLTASELVTREGILHRQERRIPVDRVQDLSFESTLVRRIFGLVVVSVETASGSGAEARLDSLGKVRAAQLREALFAVRGTRREVGAGDAEPGPGAGPVEHLLFAASSGQLALRGLTDVRIGAVLMGLFALWEFARQFGLEDRFGGYLEGALEWLRQFSVPMAIAILGSILFVILLLSMGASVVGMLMVFFGFRLTLRDGVLQRRYGMFTTRAATLPIRKIQRVLVEQNVLRRLLRVGVVRADSAGSGMDEREEARSGRDLVVPLAARTQIEHLLPVLSPGIVGGGGGQWRRASRLLILRVVLKGLIAAVALCAMLWLEIGAWAALAFVLVPVAWVVGRLVWHNLAMGQDGEHAVLQWGILGRYRAIVPHRKIQAVALRAGPLERLLGLAQVTVYVAGGSPTVMGDLAIEDAREVRDELVAAAARHRFVW